MYTSSLDYSAGSGATRARRGIDTIFERGSGTLNEDALLVADNLYGVFDGATSLCGTTYERNLTGGFLASSLAAAAFSQNDCGLRELAIRANTKIRQQMTALGIDLACKEHLWSTSAAVVRLEANSMEWCQIGDCRIQLLLEDGGSSHLVEPPDHDGETLRLWQQRGSACSEPIGVAMAAEILAVRRRMNIDFGTLSGEPAAEAFIRSGTVSLQGVRAVLLYTDGLTVPSQVCGLAHDSELFSRLFERGGLKAVRDHVKSLQQEDPDCCRYPRFKPSDDISAIAVHI